MIEKKGTYCFMVYSAKDDLPVGCYDTYKEVMDALDLAKATVWRAIYDGVIVKGLYYIEKILL